MPAVLAGTVHSNLGPSDNSYLQSAWQPSYNERNALLGAGDAEVIGTIPEPGWFLFRGLVKHDLDSGMGANPILAA